MTRSSKHFELFQPHTKHKHLLLKQYFLAWGHKLGLRSGAGDSILYVDACAGRGEDDRGNQGSPLIAADAAATAAGNIAELRRRPFTIHIVAIESNRGHAAELAALLAPYGPTVRVHTGTLSTHLPEIERMYPSIPALFFIDPFGLEPLEAHVVKAALDGERREALILFADQAALRHFGAISAIETRAERRMRAATVPLPLFPGLSVENAEALAREAAASREQLELTRASAIRIMNAAFGDDEWQARIESVPSAARRRSFLEEYSVRLRAWGASYVLPIPVVDATGVHAYTLIHATKSPKGYAAMKEAVTHTLAHSPLPDLIGERMRGMVASDLSFVEATVRVNFSGKKVRWAKDATNPRVQSVRTFLLEETPAFPFEFNAIKARLATFRVSGPAIVYEFPEGMTDVYKDRMDG